MLDMRNVCSDSEYVVRKELSRFLRDSFDLSYNDSFLWVTSRILNGGEGFTVAEPYKSYARTYLLYDSGNGKHLADDIEMALLSNVRVLLKAAFEELSDEECQIVKSYYYEHVKMSDLVKMYDISYGMAKRIFLKFHQTFSQLISDKRAEYLSVNGESVLNLRIGWKSKRLLWEAGIHSVDDLNTCFYTGSKGINKILNRHQVGVVIDALKNFETA